MQVPSESFSVQIEESSGTSHLYLTGWLDAAAVPALFRTRSPSARPLDVALDIDGLEFIDGAGWLGRDRVRAACGELGRPAPDRPRHPEDPRTRSRHFSIAGTVIA